MPLSPTEVADALGLSTMELAELLRVHRNTLRLHPESAGVEQGMAWLRPIVGLLRQIRSDPLEAAFHFKNTPVRLLGGKTMLGALLAGEHQKVARYLQVIGGGQNG